jgi:NTP pyrophosphatase (non-canonical NTP hydrolase)
MQIREAQKWVKDAWSRSEKRMSKVAELASFMEECGELGEAIRKIEHGKDKKVDMEKEMGDILLCLLTLAIRYEVDLQNAFDKTVDSVKEKYIVK